MQRREFSKKVTAAFGSLPLWTVAGTDTKQTLIKPPALKMGDRVGLIAPGSPFGDKQIIRAQEHARSLGLEPVFGAHIRAAKGYLAGTDQERLQDLHEMFFDPEIKAVWCIRGGYGCTRLLPLIDYERIRSNPKPLIGYSDITALHIALHKHAGLLTFHGPVASSDPSSYTLAYLRKALFSGQPYVIEMAEENAQLSANRQEFRWKVWKSGTARGQLIGGNLSLLAALSGSPYAASFAGKIVYIEDIGEKPYRIDRLITQLKQSSDLEQAAAILFGVFNDCEAKPGERSLTLQETLEDHFSAYSQPVAYGFSFGHIDHQFTLPVGIEAEVNLDTRTIHILESPVA
ncbi:MAG: LD-carboxypeptidase [Saprospiraceae bacterium]|nr:LD-carboxypeptidase [Saprospiraceae bacterium]